MFEAAWRLSELSMEYLSFESAFTYATFGLVTLALDGNTIKSSGPMRDDARFDAYDRLTLHSARVLHSDEQTAQSFSELVARSVHVRGDWFDYELNPRIMRTGLEILGPIIDGRFILPDDWQLPRFTLRQFAQVSRVLWVLAFIHFQARMAAAMQRCHALGFARALVLMEKGELVRRVRRYSGVSNDAVVAILDDLTYGARSQSNPDPALQPIIPLLPSKVAISPNLLMNSSMERNLSVLLNRLPEERRAYAALSQGREGASREGLIDSLSGMQFRFWYGQVPQWGGASDIDLAIVSDVERHCLILELKSFIAPAEAREIMDRSEEIRRGVVQVRDRMEMTRVLPQPLRMLLGVDERYGVTWAVASETSIGAAYVQSPDVPVINTAHLSAKLRQDPSLAACCRWLENRGYLPTEGVHYQAVGVEARIGKWTLEWYGIRGLIEDYV
jgi:hypothetical protein